MKIAQGISIIALQLSLFVPVMASTDKVDKKPHYLPIVQLNLSSSGIKNGIIDAQYGAASKDKLGAMPLESIPLQWSKGPKSTAAYAITIVDYDTSPIIGFPWIHWLTVVPATMTSLPANASRSHANNMVQGVNSYSDGVMLNMPSMKGFDVPAAQAAAYGGMVPVGFAHKYTIKVFALNRPLNLKPGYFYNELLTAMEGKVIGEGTLYGVYDAYIVHPPKADQSESYIKAHQ
ncbi:YbhB/YbcL family Raf kinase inhibitor-like protein [Deefgea piscis]|uniref:YbhB/YbcL family Raf kinase inhibitor-like protein n=1 Tax=Deefgea piscis TaxID=2739061 RepID=UPI001C8017F8|nr:YbhB/YbcL family Raf kinase inhibitor-like protein [Deefgea piscis]QZA82166.1 YbhB/YbcL family Raf kinase inhibitor-like protein [Deefgea piscis]